MTVVDLLKRARALIATPKAWCQQKAAASLFRPGYIAPSSPDATSFCAMGALIKEGFGIDDRAWCAASDFLQNAIPAGSRDSTIPRYNDTPGRTHAEILALFDRAIEAAEEAAEKENKK